MPAFDRDKYLREEARREAAAHEQAILLALAQSCTAECRLMFRALDDGIHYQIIHRGGDGKANNVFDIDKSDLRDNPTFVRDFLRSLHDTTPTPAPELEESTELCTGYKVFSLDMGTLYGGLDMPWREASMEAACLKDRVRADEQAVDRAKRHLANSECKCGIYSSDMLWRCIDDWQFGSTRLRDVVAEVVNYGIVMKHERGFRAEFTDIVQLWLPKPKSDEDLPGHSAVANMLAARYGVPVTIGYPERPAESQAPDGLLFNSGTIALAAVDPWFAMSLQIQRDQIELEKRLAGMVQVRLANEGERKP